MLISHALRDAASPALTRLEAQMLLLHTLGRSTQDRAWLLAHDQDMLDADTLTRYQAACQRRVAGEPVAYITGHKAFFGLDLQIDARVLDPRPDTETLVDWALEVMATLASPCVLDLGTGSGAIALALAHARPDAQVWAVDASLDALAVAQANAQRLDLPVQFQHGNWFAPATPSTAPPTTPPATPGWAAQRFEVMVSNPPYIAAADPHLAALTHEPLCALAAGPDGLDDLRTIVSGATVHLQPGGWLLLEHGHDQAAAVRQLLVDGGFEDVQSRNDIAGIARCSGGRRARCGQQ